MISRLVRNARHLRRNMTREEVRLWYELRLLNRQGFHFRRQVPLDGYVLDFAEFNHRLIIEVDGSQHNDEDHATRDRRRDQHFEASGFRVLRFSNIDITRSLDWVMVTIQEALASAPPALSRHLPGKRGG